MILNMNYFLAHNGTSIFHYAQLLEGQQIQTGQPFLEYFDTLEELQQRLLELGTQYQEPVQEAPKPQEPGTL